MKVSIKKVRIIHRAVRAFHSPTQSALQDGDRVPLHEIRSLALDEGSRTSAARSAWETLRTAACLSCRPQLVWCSDSGTKTS